MSKKNSVAKEPLVTGEILFHEVAHPFSRATVYIRLEDNSRSDTASRVVAEHVVRGFSWQPGSDQKLEFELSGEPPDPNASYSVRAHVDVDRDDQVSVGDYITMESYPVLTYGNSRRVSLVVREVI